MSSIKMTSLEKTKSEIKGKNSLIIIFKKGGVRYKDNQLLTARGA